MLVCFGKMCSFVFKVLVGFEGPGRSKSSVALLEIVSTTFRPNPSPWDRVMSKKTKSGTSETSAVEDPKQGPQDPYDGPYDLVRS